MYDPDELRFKLGGGFLIFFGMPFFLVGLFTFIAGLEMAVNGKAGDGLPMMAFGFIFGAVGSGFVFGRAGTILNRRDKTATTWWGLMFPFSRKAYALSDNWVHVKREIRRTKNGSYTVYCVRLSAEKDVKLSEHKNYDRARADAERAAKFLDFGVADGSSGGETIRREAGTLDESLRERLAREGKVPEMPQKPGECKVEESVEGDEAVFALPPGGRILGVLILGVGIIPLVMFGGFAATMLNSSGGNQKGVEILYVFLAVIGTAMLLGLGIPALKLLTTRETVTVSTRGVRLKKRWLLSSSTKEIPADELEELAIAAQRANPLTGQGGPIVARSDACSLTFGSGLSAEERRWLRDVILYLVTAPEQSL